MTLFVTFLLIHSAFIKLQINTVHCTLSYGNIAENAHIIFYLTSINV